MSPRADAHPDKPATNSTVHAEVLTFSRRVLGANALGWLLTVGIVVLVTLYAYRSLAADARDGGAHEAAAQLAPLKSDLAELKRQQIANDRIHAIQAADSGQLRRDVSDVQRVTLETSINLKLFMESRGLKPVELSAGKDAGP